MSRAVTRICYVIPSLSVGGTEKQLVSLIRGLVHDHEITVVCTDHAGALIGDARRLGAFVRELDMWSGWDFRMRSKLTHVFRSHRPDIVHSFMFGFDLAVNRAARDTGVPVVISSRRQLATWKKPRHVRIQRKANALVDCIVANSEAVAQHAIQQERADPTLFQVIPNGIDPDEYVSTADLRQLRLRYSIPFHTHVIGIVANFSPVKDHALFVRIAEELARRRADVHFLMVGTGPLRDAVERDIQQRGLSERFTRIATLEEIRDLYALFSVSVLCSEVEGFPNAVMESMAAGKPVVGAAVGGVPELIQDGETGRLVSTRAPEAFADAIESLLDKPAEAQAMAARARAHISTRLTLDAMVGAYRRLYTDLLVESIKDGG